jgi:putative transposase
MLNGYQFRLYPTKDQAQTLLRWIGCQRGIYNAKVSEDHYFRTFRNHSLALTGVMTPIDQTYSQFITDRTAYFREVPSVILRNGAALFGQAYQRYFKGLGGCPTKQSHRGKQSVWITSELFQFEPIADRETGEITGYRLFVGTKKFPVGELAFVTHRPFNVPASIHITIHAGKWQVAFSAEDPSLSTFKEETVIASLQKMSDEELMDHTIGADRGVAKPLMTSDGQVYDLSDAQKARIQKERKRKTRWQRRASKRQKHSKNQRKAYRKTARYQQYETNVRHDFAHQTSHQLVAHTNAKLIVFEDLKVKNMTKRPKPKQDANGKWVKNGAAAKAGLNRAILGSAWGQVADYTQYKALRAGKLLIKVAPHYSSQTCAACGHVDAGNRLSQAEFLCLRCGHEDNADHNAARVIQQRGIKKTREYAPKAKKQVKIYKTKLGSERSEGTPEESHVRRNGGNVIVQGSMSQEVSLVTAETPISSAKR